MNGVIRKLAVLPAVLLLAVATAPAFAAQQETFNQMDTNQDGTISKSEARGQLEKDFSQADENRDGTVNRSEFSAFEVRQNQQSWQNPVVGPGGMGITETYEPSRNR